MDPEKALQMLYQVVRNVKLSADDHVTLAQAYDCVKKCIKPLDMPPAPEDTDHERRQAS